MRIAEQQRVSRSPRSFDPATTVFIAAGSKAAQFVARTRRQLSPSSRTETRRRYAEARPSPRSPATCSSTGEVDEVHVVGDAVRQHADAAAVSTLEFLPIGKITGIEVPGLRRRDRSPRRHDGVPVRARPRSMLGYLLGHLPEHLSSTVPAERQGQRAERADGVDERRDATTPQQLIKDLTLEYNKLRQGSITQELLEIQGGQSL